MATHQQNQTPTHNTTSGQRRWNPPTPPALKSEEVEAKEETTEDSHEVQRRPRKVIDFDKATFKVDQESVDEIFESIKGRQEQTGEGSPAKELAAIFCGDEKFAPVIAYVVGKYLSNDIEAVQGIGYVVKGMPRKEERVEVSPQVLHAMEKLLLDSLAKQPPGGRGISEDKLVILAASKGLIRLGPDGQPNDAEIRAAIGELLSTGNYEQNRGSGIRKAMPKPTAQPES